MDFWCDGIHRTHSDLNRFYDYIPNQMRRSPQVLEAVMLHPLCYDVHSLEFFKALLCRVSDSESLREFVPYAEKTSLDDLDSFVWHRIPWELWKDKELCLALMAMHPAVYHFLSYRLGYDPDVVAALVAADPKHYCRWSRLLVITPYNVQLRHPELVLPIIKGHKDSKILRPLSKTDVAPGLWRNREVALLECRALSAGGCNGRIRNRFGAVAGRGNKGL